MRFIAKGKLWCSLLFDLAIDVGNHMCVHTLLYIILEAPYSLWLLANLQLALTQQPLI